ncbi:MAG: DNA replication and repair protein RecF [Oligoflexia bacterium]|nr:DNA replication and repair protein RecF [Oligoflexia bacterium]
MGFQNLQLKNFRSYSLREFQLDKGITVFTGSNGTGKTTVLEAISLLSSGKSFRLGKNIDFIKTDESTALIKAAENGQYNDEISISIQSSGKRISINNKAIKSAKSLLMKNPTVIFTPSDHYIIEGDSSYRKQWLNRAISNLDYEYLDLCTDFQKILTQRNKILKDSTKYSWSIHKINDLMHPWNQQLAPLILNIVKKRDNYLNLISEFIKNEYENISQTKDYFSLSYLPFGKEDFPIKLNELSEEKVHQFLNNSLQQDIYSGSTNFGPHKDEILLILNGKKVKFYGSQGEKRTCVLSLRLGELNLFKKQSQILPILLFDDVSSELDSKRRKSLVDLLRTENTQVFITATELPSTLMRELDSSFVHIELEK